MTPSAKTLRFWTSDLPLVEGKDLVIPVEADGKQFKLIRSWQSDELHLEE